MKDARISSRSVASLAPFLAPIALLAYTLMLFGEGLFSMSDVVLAERDIRYFAASRSFGFGQILAGNLPLWNPCMFAGYPYLANFTSALLYPLNAIYLVLPLSKALNTEIALHTWLLGLFMYAWVRSRGLCTLASFFSAVMVMSSGVHIAHLRVGHLSMIDAWAWAPLILLAADRLIDYFSGPVQNSEAQGENSPRTNSGAVPYILIGAFAVTMQIFAGHPQCVYYTALTLAVYCSLRLGTCFSIQNSLPPLFRAIAALTLMAIPPLLLSAAQLLPGLAVARECTRAGGTDLSFAASFSFPRENVLRLVAPNLFGSAFDPGSPWTGRSFDHESACFVGVTALVLAAVGVICAKGRLRWIAVAMVLFTAMLALGTYTPLFKLAYYGIPGFAYFRVPARLIFFSTVFGALLVGMGAHRILTHPSVNRRFAAAALGIPALSVAAGIRLSRNSTVDLSTFVWPVCIGVLLALFLVLSGGRRPWAVRAVLILGLIELSLYAHDNRSLQSLASFEDPSVTDFLAQQPGDYRILDSPALTVYHQTRPGVPNAWGSDPIMLDRYAQLVAAAGYPIDMRSGEVLPRLNRRIANLLRCRYYIEGEPDDPEIVDLGEPFPRFYFVRDYRVLPKEKILGALIDPAFDPRTSVLLEGEPDPRPAPGTHPGAMEIVSVRDGSTDHVIIDANLTTPAILVNTDAYSAGWRATSLTADPQAHYEVLPAYHGLRAIPLAAGHHTIRLEYAPNAFDVGKWVSIAAWVVMGITVLVASILRANHYLTARKMGLPESS